MGGAPGYSGSSESHATATLGIGGFNFSPKGSILGNLPTPAWIAIGLIGAVLLFKLVR
jgi:hypothetical protein